LLGVLIAALLIRPDRSRHWDTRDLFTAIAIAATAWILARSSAFLLLHESGMENVYKSAALAGLLLALDRMLLTRRTQPDFVVVVLLATLTRIDAIVPVFVLLTTFAAIWAYRFRNGSGFRFLAMSLVPWLLFMLWRRVYFDQWLPNTAVAQGISVADR